VLFDQLLFANYWHLLCHRRELSNPGDFVRFSTPGGEVVVFNDEGEFVAFDNRCAHRGARIYTDDYGNQAASCRYHGWTYQGGKVIIPNRETFGACEVDSVHLNNYKIDWCGDFIFVGISPFSTLQDQLGGVAEILQNISFNIDRRHDFNRYQYQCYWPLAVENALESYHMPMVHSETLMALDLQADQNEFHGCNSILYAPIGNEKTSKMLKRLKSLFRIDYQYQGYMSIYMFPFTMLSSTFGYSYSLQNFFPASDTRERTNFTSRLLTCNASSPNTAKILESFFDSTATVNRKVLAFIP